MMKNLKVKSDSETPSDEDLTPAKEDYSPSAMNYDLSVEEEELTPEEETELIQQEEIEAADYKLEEKGKYTYVTFVLSDDTEVVLKSPRGVELSAVDRFVQTKTKFDKKGNKIAGPGNYDTFVVLLRECIVKWGNRSRSETEIYVVTPQELLDLDDWDMFRLSHGIEISKPERKPRPRNK